MTVLRNARRERFAQELAKGLTATEAYVVAGYKPDDGNASKLSNDPEVIERVREIGGVAAEKAGITVERVIAELGLLGFSNMQDYHTVLRSGDPRDISRDQAAAIHELVVDTYMDGHGDDARKVKRVRLKLSDKRASLELLLRHLGGFKPERLEVTGKDGDPIQTEDMSARDIARRIAFVLVRAKRQQKQGYIGNEFNRNSHADSPARRCQRGAARGNHGNGDHL